jgi:hypothetical protein
MTCRRHYLFILASNATNVMFMVLAPVTFPVLTLFCIVSRSARAYHSMPHHLQQALLMPFSCSIGPGLLHPICWPASAPLCSPATYVPAVHRHPSLLLQLLWTHWVGEVQGVEGELPITLLLCITFCEG